LFEPRGPHLWIRFEKAIHTSVIVPAPRVAGGEAATPERNLRTRRPPIFCTRATPIWRRTKTTINGIYNLLRPYSSDKGAAKSGPAAIISLVHTDVLTKANKIKRDCKDSDFHTDVELFGNNWQPWRYD
jgi:hypothetical protein